MLGVTTFRISFNAMNDFNKEGKRRSKGRGERRRERTKTIYDFPYIMIP